MAVKVGILGAGFMGNRHAEILAKDKRVELVAIFDSSKPAAQKFAEKFNMKVAESLEELLDMGIDALYVLTPNAFHVEPVVLTLKKNIHVFSEKPMATNVEGATEIYNAAKASKGIYQVGLNRRFAKVYEYAKSLIDSGEVEPYLCHIKISCQSCLCVVLLSHNLNKIRNNIFPYQTDRASAESCAGHPRTQNPWNLLRFFNKSIQLNPGHLVIITK